MKVLSVALLLFSTRASAFAPSFTFAAKNVHMVVLKAQANSNGGNAVVAPMSTATATVVSTEAPTKTIASVETRTNEDTYDEPTAMNDRKPLMPSNKNSPYSRTTLGNSPSTQVLATHPERTQPLASFSNDADEDYKSNDRKSLVPSNKNSPYSRTTLGNSPSTQVLATHPERTQPLASFSKDADAEYKTNDRKPLMPSNKNSPYSRTTLSNADSTQVMAIHPENIQPRASVSNNADEDYKANDRKPLMPSNKNSAYSKTTLSNADSTQLMAIHPESIRQRSGASNPDQSTMSNFLNQSGSNSQVSLGNASSHDVMGLRRRRSSQGATESRDQASKPAFQDFLGPHSKRSLSNVSSKELTAPRSALRRDGAPATPSEGEAASRTNEEANVASN